jgi:hypothetical protein
MKTLNQIAENIAFKLGDQFNHTLQESIKDTLIDWRAKFLRDDADRNFISDIHFSQTITIQFQKVNLLTEFNANFDCINSICSGIQEQEEYMILKSTKKIPLPIRTKISHTNPYNYIGSIDGFRSFKYTTIDKFPYLKHLKYNSRVIYYIIIDGYLYIINNLDLCDINNTLNICNVMIRGVFENPREVFKVCSVNNGFADDAIFPIGVDMLMQISNGIVRGEYPLKSSKGEEINIKNNDNNQNNVRTS